MAALKSHERVSGANLVITRLALHVSGEIEHCVSVLRFRENRTIAFPGKWLSGAGRGIALLHLAFELVENLFNFLVKCWIVPHAIRRATYPILTAPHSPVKRIRNAPAFSLVELLAVIAIIGLLLAVAVPIFSDPGNNAHQASREIVKAHIQQARAHAIASGNATAVAIPVLSTGGELGGRAISLFEVVKTGAGYEPAKDGGGGERLLQRWETLPGSFHFMPACLISATKPTIVDAAATLQTNHKGKPVTCHLIVFAPNGQIVLPASETNIAIARAVSRGNSLTLTQKSNGSPVFDLLQVDRLTGRTRSIQPQ
jgi:prepilin-type N-terminal cleavage/methylation domain-containing protein